MRIVRDPKDVSELNEAGRARFKERIAHLEQAEATESQRAAFERDIERVRLAKLESHPPSDDDCEAP